MMITKLFTLLFSFAMLAASAQQDYKSTLAEIVKHSATNFKMIKGAAVISETEKYESTLQLGKGSDFRSWIVPGNPISFYSSSLYKNEESKRLEESAKQFIKEHYADPVYIPITINLGDGHYKSTVYKKNVKNTHDVLFLIHLEPRDDEDFLDGVDFLTIEIRPQSIDQ